MLWRAAGIDYGPMGYRGPAHQKGEPAGSANADFNRLLLALHHRPDLCGLAVAGVSLIWLGGYTHLHRDVAFFELDPPTPAGSPAANYVLAPSSWSRPPAAVEVAREGRAALYRYDRRCAPAPPRHRFFELPPR